MRDAKPVRLTEAQKKIRAALANDPAALAEYDKELGVMAHLIDRVQEQREANRALQVELNRAGSP